MDDEEHRDIAEVLNEWIETELEDGARATELILHLRDGQVAVIHRDE